MAEACGDNTVVVISTRVDSIVVVGTALVGEASTVTVATTVAARVGVTTAEGSVAVGTTVGVITGKAANAGAS